MKKPALDEMEKTISANIAADTLARLVRWACWLAIMGGLVAPLAWHAFRTSGALVGLVVLALCVLLCNGVKPSGPSYGARVRAIEREHWPKE